jgi:hypothetical protein
MREASKPTKSLAEWYWENFYWGEDQKKAQRGKGQ